MGQAVRELMKRLAEELGERATVRVDAVDSEAERIELLPRNPAAASVAVEHSLDVEDDEFWITIADKPESGDLEWLDVVVRAAVAGRIRLLQGSGRERLEIEGVGDFRPSTGHDLFRGLLPAPGWQGRATVTQFEPYT